MPFSFLNPWFWLGALAIAAPLWLHLRRKQERNLVRFSAVQFLEDQPEPRRSPYRLRDVLLFALRALAVLLLAAAFAWPYLRGPETLPVRESRVYILDNTLSHQAGGAFEKTRARLAEELGQLGQNVQAAVVELAAVPRTLVTFADDHRTARERVQNLPPSYQRGSYVAAFRQANSLLANSLGEEKRIIFLGDSQENQWTENVNTPPFLRKVKVDVPKPVQKSLPSLSLFDPRAQRIFLGDKTLIHFTVKLRHLGGANRASVAIRVNDQALVNRPMDLSQEPDTVLLQAQWEADPSAWIRGEAAVEGENDALPGDNRVYFSVPPVLEGKVALLAQSRFLQVALSPEIMRGQWAVRNLDQGRLAAELADNKDCEVLCVESSFLQSADARRLLHRYLSNGRGVVLFVNRVTPAIRGCLRELGFEAETELEEAGEDKLQFVLSNHPIFHPFLSPEYGKLMEVGFDRYARLKGAQAMPLLFTERGAALFFEATQFPGKLLVAAFGMEREHTTWPVHQTFVPFLDLALQAARAEDPTPTHFEPGEIATVILPPGATAQELVLRQADQEAGRAPVEQGRAQLRMPDKPGLYNLSYNGGQTVEKVFSVNVSARESELVFAEEPEAMRTWRLDTGGNPAETAAQVRRSAQVSLSAILQQRFWWWMVLGALAALAMELPLAAMRKERV